jgi:hypothetical protein
MSTGGFYQDEMGETEFKYCSKGTYVSEERHPGKRATDCWACPYGRYCAISLPEPLHPHATVLVRERSPEQLGRSL